MTHPLSPAIMDDQESEEQWKDHQGNPLHPARWLQVQLDQDAAAAGESGRCLGLCCLPWVRCEKASLMKHSLFGGSEHRSGETKGWGALSFSAMASGAPKFHGGLAVLKHLMIKVAEYLHEEHAALFPSLRLPPAEGRITLPQVFVLCPEHVLAL